jgi:hypothetical protein
MIPTPMLSVKATTYFRAELDKNQLVNWAIVD